MCVWGMRKKEKKGGGGGGGREKVQKEYESVFARTCKFKISKLVLITFMHFKALVLLVVVLIVMIFVNVDNVQCCDLTNLYEA